MAIQQRRDAQPQTAPSRQRRPIHKMFQGTAAAAVDFYSPEPVQKARQQWFSDAPSRLSGPMGTGAFDQETRDRIARDSQMRMMQQQGRLQQKQMPLSGASSGYGQSHTPVFGPEHPLVFSEEQGQDLNFQATQQGGNPWFNPHQQATRFAETFGAESIRKKQDPSPFGR